MQSPSAAPLLTIVVPTFNETQNLAELARRLEQVLAGVTWELIFVDDDSPDGTAAEARRLAQQDGRIRCLQRIGRRGLSSACIEGLLASSAPFLAVMDADLQHDETLLAPMLMALRSEPLDIVVGSRYMDGGSVGDWDGGRQQISRLATRISRLVVPATLTDPMSGFFMLRADTFHAHVRQLSALGFKILIDLFASSPVPLRFKELPYTFRNRVAGESKLDHQVAWDYGLLLLDKLVGHVVPARFISFALIGGLGVFVHLLVLSLLFHGFHLEFGFSQAAAAGVAMLGNFSVNNLLTYRDRRLRGAEWVKGLLSFVLVCAVGAVANVGIASYIFSSQGTWLIAALAGILVGAVWNYAVSSVYTWGRKPRPVSIASAPSA
ncbi:glycosyltransferase family 2 protein [Pelomonas sp. SE-A7]|uniref:glycosyltransferase n=1 Tax=Pelomonas sp. SE-A7 TaxID=3054953 RepID=UPI00259CD67B|nr:glycosyltransferase family 2 protein [Pelomonas sp. SE-A7]MDM4765836.1 glycosyltransferase family 2 protein [Pelomonas sp. SE-A7]